MKTAHAEETGVSEPFQPKTPLGRRLWELRQKIVASGEELLDEEGIEREVRERRGGFSDDGDLIGA